MSVKVESLAGEIIDIVLKQGKSVIVEAYPGFGKTKLAAHILSSVHRGVVAVRTHNEIFEVFNFLPDRTGTVYAYGKPKICYIQSNFSYRYCRAMNLFGRCNTDFGNRDVAWLAATLRKPSEIVDYEKKHNKCLYKALRMLAKKARKIVATYDYLVSNPDVLEDRDVVVFDEAHHILSYIDELVVEIDGQFVESMVKSLKENIETRALAYAMRTLFRKSSSIREFIERLSEIISNFSIGTESEAVKLIDRIVVMYYSGKHYIEDGKCYILTDVLPELAKLENKVMLGIYLPPFFLDANRNAEHIVVEGEPRINVTIDTSLSTKYTERGDETYRDYAKKIEEYIDYRCGNLVVFPSYSVMEEVKKYLSDSVKRRVFEPKEDIDEIPDGSILLDVAGGRFSEGVNIKNLCNVVVIGMPYPEPTPYLNLLSKVFGFDNIYTYIALLRTYQAIGRIRGTGRAVLIDKRFLIHKEKLPKWVKLEHVV